MRGILFRNIRFPVLWGYPGSEAWRSSGSIVKADAFTGGEGLVQIRQITGGNCFGFLLIIGDGLCDIVIDISHSVQIRGGCLYLFLGCFYSFTLRGEIYVLIWIQIGNKVALQLNVNGFTVESGIFVTCYIFICAYGV